MELIKSFLKKLGLGKEKSAVEESKPEVKVEEVTPVAETITKKVVKPEPQTKVTKPAPKVTKPAAKTQVSKTKPVSKAKPVSKNSTTKGKN